MMVDSTGGEAARFSVQPCPVLPEAVQKLHDVQRLDSVQRQVPQGGDDPLLQQFLIPDVCFHGQVRLDVLFKPLVGESLEVHFLWFVVVITLKLRDVLQQELFCFAVTGGRHGFPVPYPPTIRVRAA